METKQFTIQKQDVSVSQNSKLKNFVITKRIAKHGNQAIIVIPKLLEQELMPGIIAKITIDIIGEAG